MTETHRTRDEIYRGTAPYAALFLRVGLGAVFLAHSLLKGLVLTLPVTAQFFEAHGYPGWTAYPVFVMELVGGALLVAGVFTRPMSLALVPVMIGALPVHWSNGWSFSAPGGGWEYVAFLTVALLAQALLGNGALALGGLRWKQRPRNDAEPQPA